MKLTREQLAIIQSKGNIKINAIAGSGKTTTVIEYAKARPRNSKILYLAFNKSVKLEALQKFRNQRLTNVQVETAHSLAYKHVVRKNGYTIRSQGYKIHELTELLGLQGNGEKHAEYIVANHINKFIAYFCNSNKNKVQELNYLDVVTDKKAKAFVKKYYKYIENQTRLLLGKMNAGTIDVTHDFYLKKFQLSHIRLPYDYILFDEGQDASEAMLDVFLNQQATKIIVGDTFQQIYGWRYAINSLEKTDFKAYTLSVSFRFGNEIADLAKTIIGWKKHLDLPHEIQITGKGAGNKIKTKAVLARTNLGLLLKAIETITEKKKINKIYFEGNINSYTYADNGTSLYDVLNLYNGNRHLIKNRLIQTMRNIDELKEYIENADEMELAMMLEIVKEYGNEIPGIIKSIKNKHVGDDQRDEAQMIFSTVHRGKGMEYDAIELVDDFLTETKLKEQIEGAKKNQVNKKNLNEEINLLYVAITRTKNTIHIPATLLPENIKNSSIIHRMQVPFEDIEFGIQVTSDVLGKNNGESYAKTQPAGQMKIIQSASYKPWTDDLDDDLERMYCEGISIKDMSSHFNRTRDAIQSRIKKLKLREKYFFS